MSQLKNKMIKIMNLLKVKIKWSKITYLKNKKKKNIF